MSKHLLVFLSPSDHRAAISELLHTNEFSRVDNNDKIPTIIDLGLCQDTGARIYDLHERRELMFDDNELLDELTGRNRLDKSRPNPPHPTWTQIKQDTTTDSRPRGIKGSTKLIRSCKCPCMKKMKASICSCSICERARDALRRFNKYQVGWHLQAANKRKLEIIRTKEAEGMAAADIHKYLEENPDQLLCQKCNGKCHPGSSYRSFSTSMSTCIDALLCEKVHVPELDLPILDINFRPKNGEIDEFYIHPEDCCYGDHRGFSADHNGTTKSQQKCGWDAVFRDMPLHKRKETNPNTSEEIIHCLRACPDEYERNGKVTWMDFIKVCMNMIAD